VKKVVLTGSTGLIGKEAKRPLQMAGFEVIDLTRKDCDLLNHNQVENFFKHHKPQYLLHFAWITGNGCLSASLNNDLCDAIFFMQKAFCANGGKRAVFSGTCFEYDFSDEPLKENAPIKPRSLYAQKKHELNMICSSFAEKNNISYAWGRIFYVYGHDEKQERLTAYIINRLLQNEIAVVNFGQLKRDYMYTEDISAAFVKLLDSDIVGNVNVCTGEGITLESYAKMIAKKLHKENLLKIHHALTDQPLNIIGDNTILTKRVGFIPKYDYSTALNNILSRLL